MNDQRKMKSLIQGMMIFLACATAASAARRERWVHVRVETTRGISSGVSINVPIKMAESVLTSTPNGDVRHGKFNVQASVNGADFRAMLRAIRHSPDGVFVTLDRNNHQIEVAKSKGDLLIRFVENSTPEHRWTKSVSVRVPLRVVRAMLTRNSDQLNIARGIKALARTGDLDVTISGPKETVRVWTDTQTVSD